MASKGTNVGAARAVVTAWCAKQHSERNDWRPRSLCGRIRSTIWPLAGVLMNKAIWSAGVLGSLLISGSAFAQTAAGSGVAGAGAGAGSSSTASGPGGSGMSTGGRATPSGTMATTSGQPSRGASFAATSSSPSVVGNTGSAGPASNPAMRGSSGMTTATSGAIQAGASQTGANQTGGIQTGAANQGAVASGSGPDAAAPANGATPDASANPSAGTDTTPGRNGFPWGLLGLFGLAGLLGRRRGNDRTIVDRTTKSSPPL